MRPNRVIGLVLNWTALEMAHLHADALATRAKFVVDATARDTEVVKVVQRKVPGKLLTPSGEIIGEKSMWSDVAKNSPWTQPEKSFPAFTWPE